jgi:hypothetical protein
LALTVVLERIEAVYLHSGEKCSAMYVTGSDTSVAYPLGASLLTEAEKLRCISSIWKF